MPKEASAANPSVPLHEVLEAEFAALHGQLPPDYSNSSDPNVRLKAVWTAVHKLPEKRAALCISGGGIRAATFGLGVMQGLARCSLLNRFHYLSSVAGGAQIAGWLNAWAHRAPGGLTSVVASLTGPLRDAGLTAEPSEIQKLRIYSNYLSPHFGFFSTDTWRLLATYLRNLAAMSLVLIPLLAATLTIPWIYVSILMLNPPPNTNVLLWAGTICITISLSYIALNLPSSRNLRWDQKRFLLFCLTPLLLASILMTMHWAWSAYYGQPLMAWPLFGFGSPRTWVPFLYLGVAVHLSSWMPSFLGAHGFRLLECLGLIVSGAIAGFLFWLGAEKLFPHPLMGIELYTCFSVPLFLFLFFLDMLVIALISSRWTDDPDREWWGRAAGLILSALIVWIGVSTLMLFGPYLLTRAMIWGTSTLTVGGVAGVFTLLAGRFGLIPSKIKQDDKFGPLAFVLFNVTSVAALLFGIALIVLIFRGITLMASYIGNVSQFFLMTHSRLLGEADEHLNMILYTPWWEVVIVAALLAFVGITLGGLINVNKFSLQAMYRDRLIPAYLGAANANRRPNPFTGYDWNDNLHMGDLWTSSKFGGMLFPVINATVNLVGGANLAWQATIKTSFTISPLHCGSDRIGYRATIGPPDQRYGRISLGTAIAISGAAANPNVGYYTSPLVRLVLTLLNARLGAWFGNPGKAGDHTFHLSFPSFSVGPTIAETFGLNDDRFSYVNISDGRHFENLGLYEMVLRRCHHVVVCDGGKDADCTLEYLGTAVRKIRIELGIPIEFRDINIYSRSEDAAQNSKGRHCAIGRICYSVVDGSSVADGVLIYIRPAWYGDGPADIVEYSRRNEAFPHEASGDRFFTEAQFESYRMLGAYTVEKLSTDCGGDFGRFIHDIFEKHLQTAPPDWLAPLIQPSPNVTGATTG